MNNVKESLIISAGVTAPVWLPAMNEWAGCLTGMAALFYICVKIYFLLAHPEKIK